MGDLVTAVSSAMTGIFSAIITAFANIGNLIFTFGEQGAISGVSPFGYFLALIIGVPAGTWLFSKLLGLIRSIKIGSAK